MMKGKYLIQIICLLTLFASQQAFAQSEGYTLSGWIKNLNDEAIGNVTISIIGEATSPAISDEDGNYHIDVPSGNVQIRFQPLGNYRAKTVFLNNRKTLNIYLVMKETSHDYDLVVYEGQKLFSRNLITAHQNLSNKELSNSNNLSIDQFFQTSLPGAVVNNMSGMPGSGTSTFLRGINTLNSGSQPLYIVDGIPIERSNYYTSLYDGFNYNPLTTIDPLDISYITVSKDPSHTAQYGYFGSNGVIEIRTIAPNQSKTLIDIKYRTGITQKPNFLPQLESGQYKTLANEILFSSGMHQEDYEVAYPGLFYSPEDGIDYIPYSHNTNWQDEIYQNAVLQNIHFSIKGGDEIANYGISFGYLDQEGILQGTSYDKFNTRFAGTFNIIERVKMALNVSLTNTNSKVKESALTPSASPIMAALWKSPILGVYDYDTNGNQLKEASPLEELGVSNPYAISNGYDGKNKNTRFSTSAKATGEISKNLALTAQVGVNYNAMTENSFFPSEGMDLLLDDEAYNQSSRNTNTYLGIFIRSYLNYSKALGSHNAHQLNWQTGAKTQMDEFQSDYAITRNTPSDDYTNLSTGESKLRELGGNNISYRWMSLYSNFNYNIKDKYILNASLSSDASSSIGQDSESAFALGNVPYNVFYSLGAAWRLSNGLFLKDIAWLEELKVRASYGTSGNDNFDILLSRSNYTTSHFNKRGVAVPGNFANTGLNHETVNTLNVGSDIAIKGGRHQLSFDAYNAVTNDALLYNALESFTGYDYVPVNGGKISNKGIEATFYSRLIGTPDFALDLGFKAGKFKNEVLNLPKNEYIISLPGDGEMITRTGKEANSFYGYIYEGVYTTSTESQDAALINDRGQAYTAGDAKFKDISGAQGTPDGIINDYDKVILGSPNPDLTGTINLDVSYKNIALKAVTQFATGYEIYNYVRYQNESMNSLNNQSVKTLQRWTSEGQETEIPRAEWNDPQGNNAFSSRWIEDGSYLRLKEITLSYQIKKQIAMISNIELYASAYNLMTFTNYLGYDPEMSYSYSPYTQGIDYGLTPQSRSFIVGVNIGL